MGRVTKGASKTTKGDSETAKKSSSSPLPSVVVTVSVVVVIIAAAGYVSLQSAPPTKAASDSRVESTAAQKIRRRYRDGFVASVVPLVDSVGPREVKIFESGGNKPLGKRNITKDNFHELGLVYNSRGQVVPSFASVGEDARLWHGPNRPGQHFMWPGMHAGHRVTVPGIMSSSDEPIELETLSTGEPGSPRVFYVHNFLSDDEAKQLIDFSTDPKNPYGMQPSTAGTEKAWNQGGTTSRTTTRTSMNAFDISTQNSRDIKKRSIDLLRMGAYEEPLLDGIQVLRYEVGQAYIPHEDYFQISQSQDHNWDPAVGGSNRFATIFLYLNDVEEGGHTVFPHLDAIEKAKLTKSTRDNWDEANGKVPSKEELQGLIKDANLTAGSWEDKLLQKCYYTKFAIPPRRGDAILFYSQTPMGHLDPASNHGACPVLKGQKWAANIWVWNACRWSLCKDDAMQPSQELPEALKAAETAKPPHLEWLNKARRKHQQ